MIALEPPPPMSPGLLAHDAESGRLPWSPPSAGESNFGETWSLLLDEMGEGTNAASSPPPVRARDRTTTGHHSFQHHTLKLSTNLALGGLASCTQLGVSWHLPPGGRQLHDPSSKYSHTQAVAVDTYQYGKVIS